VGRGCPAARTGLECAGLDRGGRCPIAAVEGERGVSRCRGWMRGSGSDWIGLDRIGLDGGRDGWDRGPEDRWRDDGTVVEWLNGAGASLWAPRWASIHCSASGQPPHSFPPLSPPSATPPPAQTGDSTCTSDLSVGHHQDGGARGGLSLSSLSALTGTTCRAWRKKVR